MTATDAVADPPIRSDAAPAPKLRGQLGVVALLFSVMAFNGSLAGVIGFTPVVIAYGNGLGAPVCYAAAAILVALFAAGFTKLTKFVSRPGGFYSYVTLGLGREAGLGTSFLAVACYYLLLLGNFAFAGFAAQAVVHGLLEGPDLQWWVYSLVCLVICGVLGYLELDISAKFLIVFLAAEVLIVVVYDLAVVVQGGADGLSARSFQPDEILSGSVGLGMLFALYLMSGFEVTALFRDEVRDPEKTVPRASYLFIFAVSTLYGVSAWVLIQALGNDNAVEETLANPTGAFIGTMEKFIGRLGSDLVTILLCTSLLAAAIATHNVLSRYVFNLAADNILPARFAEVHERHGSPARASVVTTIASVIGIIAFIVTAPDPKHLYAQLSGGFSYGFIMMLVVTSVAIPAYFLRVQRPPGVTIWHAAIAPGIAFLGLGTALYLATANFDSLITGTTWIVAVLTALYGSFVLGAVTARVLKHRRPATYAKIGRQ